MDAGQARAPCCASGGSCLLAEDGDVCDVQAPAHGVLDGVLGAAQGAVVGGDEEGGVVHQVPIAALHAVRRVAGGDQGLVVAGGKQGLVALVLCLRPVVTWVGQGTAASSVISGCFARRARTISQK